MPSSASAQQFLAVDTIREDVVVLKDKSLRMVLMCSSLNFALKSADEQEAITFLYQNFLNSLDFPLEFVIHSRRLNIAPYLAELEERQKDEPDDLLKVQISEYIEFIKTFVALTYIMSKTFYAVVPFTPAIVGAESLGPLKGLASALGLGKKTSAGVEEDAFEEYKNQLLQRVNTVVTGLQRIGIRSTPLNTEELIELFYGLYNPTEFEKALTPAE